MQVLYHKPTGRNAMPPSLARGAGTTTALPWRAMSRDVLIRRLCWGMIFTLGEPIVYQVPLSQLGLACETITGDLRDQLGQAIGALDEGRTGPGSRMVAWKAVSALRGRQVGGIILGCTEIPLLLNQELDDPFLINPVQLLAEAAVRRALA